MRPPTSESRGFALIELIVVIVILGTLAALSAPALNGLTPISKLRAGARKMGGFLDRVRSHAAVLVETHHVWYDLKKQQFFIVLPPDDDEDPNMALEDRERLGKLELPNGIRIEKIILADGTEVEDDELYVEIDPLGFEGSHIIYLINSEEHRMAVRYNALLGEVTYFNKEVKFEQF